MEIRIKLRELRESVMIIRVGLMQGAEECIVVMSPHKDRNMCVCVHV